MFYNKDYLLIYFKMVHINKNEIAKILNTNINLLYKETEEKYKNDEEVDEEDMYFFCDQLYQHELLLIFNLKPDEYPELSKKVEQLYAFVHMIPEIEELINENKIMDDNIISFNMLFSYDLLYKVYSIIVEKMNSGIME
jgi:hypothetical protein